MTAVGIKEAGSGAVALCGGVMWRCRADGGGALHRDRVGEENAQQKERVNGADGRLNALGTFPSSGEAFMENALPHMKRPNGSREQRQESDGKDGAARKKKEGEEGKVLLVGR